MWGSYRSHRDWSFVMVGGYPNFWGGEGINNKEEKEKNKKAEEEEIEMNWIKKQIGNETFYKRG